MIYLYIFIFVLAFIFLPYFRCACMHPFKSIYYIIKDISLYVYYRKWREFKDYGKIICATALFGGGKTLTSTKYIRSIYSRFNGKKVYNKKTKTWVKQRIIVHSNVHFNDIDYVDLKSTKSIFDVTKSFNDDTFMDVHIFFIDEASTQFNSRQFKDNFNANLLNTILTCRHYKMSFVLTSQRFNHMDALLRQVTGTAKECAHIWRLYKIAYYDAYMLENCANPTLIKPIKVRTMFICDRDFNAYDTFACVGNLIKAKDDNDLMPDDEIIALRDYQNNDDNTFYMSKKYRKKVGNTK